jgi:tyrosinase
MCVWARKPTNNLRPVSPLANPAPPANPRSDGFGDNPRCLRRDLGSYLTSNYATTSIIANLITGNTNINSFQTVMQNAGFGGAMGVHGAAHFTIGSDPGGDFYTSPNDPAFWLLHSMIDRVWYIWQTQDLPNRLQVIAGGTSMMGGGAMQQLSDVQNLGIIRSETYPISSLVSTVDGPFCYVYESSY